MKALGTAGRGTVTNGGKESEREVGKSYRKKPRGDVN